MDTKKLFSILLKCGCDTITHSIRVMKRSNILGKKLGLSENDRQALYYGALLHDVGKQLIPNTILEKPGKLTEKEYGLVQQHPTFGSILLKGLLPKSSIEIVLHHHERFDGNGYPHKLQGEGIPYLARIVSVVDAYDAMISDRHYHPALRREKAIKEIRGNLGSQFDPQIGQLFLDMNDYHSVSA